MVCNGKFKKILIILCIMAVVLSAVPAYALAAVPIETASPSVIVTELSSDTVLMSEKPDMSINPGGLVKIAALYVLARECFRGAVSLSDKITVTQSVMAKDSGQIPLKEDEVFTLEQLMYLMYMDYSDTAAVAAAVHAAGSVEGFVQKMNEIADESGCTDTHFTNVTGADNDSQHTTPSDMLLILKTAMQNSVFMDVFTAASYTVRETNKSIARSMGTQNLLQRPGSDYYVRTCKGGRLGGFSGKGYATISLSEGADTGMQLIVITAGGEEYGGSYKDASGIISWIFDNFSWQTVIKAGDTITRIPIEMGSGTDYVAVGTNKDINVLTDNETSELDFDRQVTVYSERNGEKLKAPVKRGEVLGELTLTYGGKVYGTVPLVASRDVDLMRWEYFKSEVRGTIRSSGIIWCIVVIAAMLLAYLVYAVLFWRRQAKLRRESRAAREALIARRRSAPAYAAPSPEEKKLPKAFIDSVRTSGTAMAKPMAEKKPNSTQEIKPKENNAQKSSAQKSSAQKSSAQKSNAQKSSAQKSNAQKSNAQKTPVEEPKFFYDFSLDIPEDAAYEILYDAYNSESAESAESSMSAERPE